MSALDRLWYDDSRGAKLGRAVLAPPAILFGAVARVRATLYDRGALAVQRASLPVLSVGNLSVGGTGKTPIAAWAAARLRTLGAHPSIVLRGYGGDETLVHAALNPDVPVIADAHRPRGVERARAAGADCVVLDDGFQHRRLARTVDWVLISAERFPHSRCVLPAGPLREPVSALHRANLLIVTRKSASLDDAEAVAAQLSKLVPDAPTAVCRLAPIGFVDAIDGVPAPLERVRGARILAVAAIGDPDAFFAQIRSLGAASIREVPFRDHHHFARRDVDRLIERSTGLDAVICTLKDAVKLAPLWPHVAPPLWYVSQQAEIERGGTALDASLAEVLSARASNSSTAGAAG